MERLDSEREDLIEEFREFSQKNGRGEIDLEKELEREQIGRK